MVLACSKRVACEVWLGCAYLGGFVYLKWMKWPWGVLLTIVVVKWVNKVQACTRPGLVGQSGARPGGSIGPNLAVSPSASSGPSSSLSLHWMIRSSCSPANWHTSGGHRPSRLTLAMLSGSQSPQSISIRPEYPATSITTSPPHISSRAQRHFTRLFILSSPSQTHACII